MKSISHKQLRLRGSAFMRMAWPFLLRLLYLLFIFRAENIRTISFNNVDTSFARFSDLDVLFLAGSAKLSGYGPATTSQDHPNFLQAPRPRLGDSPAPTAGG